PAHRRLSAHRQRSWLRPQRGAAVGRARSRIALPGSRAAARGAPSHGRTTPLRMSDGLQSDPRFAGVRIHASSYANDPVEIGEGATIWHFCHVLPRVRIGRNCSIGQNVMISPNVTVGAGCKTQNNVSLYEGVTLEDDVFCGPSCVFTNVLNPRAFVSRKAEFEPTLVRRGATIGANAPIVWGCTTGAHAFIAAGAVKTADVVDFAL